MKSRLFPLKLAVMVPLLVTAFAFAMIGASLWAPGKASLILAEKIVELVCDLDSGSRNAKRKL